MPLVKFVNHTATISGKRTIEFVIFTHPAKPKENGYRRIAWLDWRPQNYEGDGLECLPNDGPWGIDGSDETFKYLNLFLSIIKRFYYGEINSWPGNTFYQLLEENLTNSKLIKTKLKERSEILRAIKDLLGIQGNNE